jgi:hypothetical protein
MTKLGQVILRDTRANQPAAGVEGRLYYVTDELVLERDSGSVWESVSSAGFTNPMTTAGDIIKGGSAGAPQRLAIGSSGDVLTVSAGAPAWAPSSSGPPSHAYFDQACALLEPLAIEPAQIGTFSYVIGSSETKYMLAAWNCRVGSTGRIETRDIRNPLPLRNITIVGIASTSIAAFIDPTLPTYADSWTTYYDRLLALTTFDTKYLAITGLSGGANTKFVFLPGPYGTIITNITTFNYTWTAPTAQGIASGDFPVQYELGDANTDWVRFSNTMMFPVSKFIVRSFEAGFSGGVGTAAGSVAYVLLPSTWGAVTDPNTYLFRDDFMGATLDTGSTWTRSQSTTGNIEIDTNFAWCKAIGNGSWGTNGAYSQFSTSRAAGKVFECDVYGNVNNTYSGSDFPNLMVGWSDGGGQADTNFSHAVDFTSFGGAVALFVFENGTSRGAVGSGYTAGHIYRVRITLGSSNDAT